MMQCLLLLLAVWNSFAAFPSMDVNYHPIATTSEKAQQHFDDGLINLYAYTYPAAYISFKRASLADPNCAMAYWGMARARLKMPFKSKEECQEAYALIEKAEKLAKTAHEQAYIQALFKRCPHDTEEDEEELKASYRDAMKKVYESYPQDLDLGALYVDCIMEMQENAWDGSERPLAGTLECLKVLRWILRTDPSHIGANHFFIHCIEASHYPERGIPSAHFFEAIKKAPPHLLHMPAHIYILLGDYQKSVQANLRAIAYEKKFKESYELPLKFPMHFYFFLVRSYMWQENREKARATASKAIEQDLTPYLEMLLYFHRWDEILALEKPKEKPTQKEGNALAFWHFSRGMAFCNKNNIEKAQEEQKQFLELKEKKSVLERVAEQVLEAQIFKLQGDKKSFEKHLLLAIDEADQLHFNEPPNWFHPLRQTLGAYYFQEGELEKARTAFVEALDQLPRNGRSLFGLWNVLKALQKTEDVYWVEREMKEALQYSDHDLTIDLL